MKIRCCSFDFSLKCYLYIYTEHISVVNNNVDIIIYHLKYRLLKYRPQLPKINVKYGQLVCFFFR